MTIKKIFKVSGMHCTGCTLEIDDVLEETGGIEEANTHYAKAQTEVKFNPEKVSEEKIVKLIKSVGYDATLVAN
jgi:copper chaperone CopZ